MESIQIYLNSKTANKFNDNNIADAEYILPMIEIPDGYYIYISLQKASIPYTFYNINENNNYISFIANIGDLQNEYYSYSVPVGNYNINQLINVLKAEFVTINITYNSITNKLTFVNQSGYLKLNGESTILSVIGFNDNVDVLGFQNFNNNTFSIESTHCCNLVTVKTINIGTNLMTKNINKAIPNNASIIASIPIIGAPYSMIQYENNNDFRCNLFVNTLSMLNVKLMDDMGNLIDLNGVHYSMTFQIDIMAFK